MSTKAAIQQGWQEFVSEAVSDADLNICFTTGSSGTPLRVARTTAEALVAARHLFRARQRAGLQLPARWARVVGPLMRHDHPDALRLAQQDRSSPSIDVICDQYTPAQLDLAVRRLEHYQPQWISSVPSTLDQIASRCLDQGRRIELHQVRLISAGAELFRQEARGRIAAVFGGLVVSQYGAQEMWPIGMDCRMGMMHVITENVYFEVLDDSDQPVPAGQPGEAVVTGLNQHAMPFIRYRLGDLVRYRRDRSACACGDPRPCIELLGGRTIDYIVGQDGKVGNVAFEALFKLLHRVRGTDVRQFRVVQRSPALFEVWTAPRAAWDEQSEELFAREGRLLLGEAVRFTFAQVDAIPTHPSGKDRPFLVDLDSGVPLRS